MRGSLSCLGLFLSAASLSIFAASPTRAASIGVSTANSNSPIAFSELGSFVDAGNFNNLALPTDTRGTNVFVTKVLPGTTSPQILSTTNGLTVSMSAATDGLASTDLRSGAFTDGLYLTEFYSPDQSGAHLVITGLNPAKSYLIQFPHGESRDIPYHGTQTFTDSNGNVTSLLDFGQPLYQPYALITVTVSNTASLDYFMPGSTSPGFRGPSFNGYTVRDVSPVPTPHAFFGGLTLLASLRLLRSPRKR